VQVSKKRRIWYYDTRFDTVFTGNNDTSFSALLRSLDGGKKRLLLPVQLHCRTLSYRYKSTGRLSYRYNSMTNTDLGNTVNCRLEALPQLVK